MCIIAEGPKKKVAESKRAVFENESNKKGRLEVVGIRFRFYSLSFSWIGGNISHFMGLSFSLYTFSLVNFRTALCDIHLAFVEKKNIVLQERYRWIFFILFFFSSFIFWCELMMMMMILFCVRLLITMVEKEREEGQS